MLYWEDSAQLWVFIFYGIETMGALCNQAIKLHLLQGCYVLFSQDLKQVFVTHAPGSFSATGFI